MFMKGLKYSIKIMDNKKMNHFHHNIYNEKVNIGSLSRLPIYVR